MTHERDGASKAAKQLLTSTNSSQISSNSEAFEKWWTTVWCNPWPPNDNPVVKNICSQVWQAAFDYAMRARISGPEVDSLILPEQTIVDILQDTGDTTFLRASLLQFASDNLKIEPPVGVDELLPTHTELSDWVEGRWEWLEKGDEKDILNFIREHVRRKLR